MKAHVVLETGKQPVASVFLEQPPRIGDRLRIWYRSYPTPRDRSLFVDPPDAHDTYTEYRVLEICHIVQDPQRHPNKTPWDSAGDHALEVLVSEVAKSDA